MRPIHLILFLALASGAAAVAAISLRPHAPEQHPPAPPPPATAPPPALAAAPPAPVPPAASAAREEAPGALSVSVQLERRYLGEQGAEAYLEVDVVARGAPEQGARVPVNAVLVLDRSGSMAGAKIERAREAARALIAALDGEDRLAVVDFASDARLLVPSTAMTPAAKEEALGRVASLYATSGTNLSAALALAGPQLRKGQAPYRLDKVFLASDGLANEGISERPALVAFAKRAVGEATLSTFGLGDDYDEEVMSALAVQSGGRARFIRNEGELAGAFSAELTRAARAVAKDVMLEVRGLAGARVERILGFELASGRIRLPDFAAGESRRILVKLALPPGRGRAELARVVVSFADAKGALHGAEAAAQATYTADAALLREAPSEVAVRGAQVEMKQLAREAAEKYEAGNAGGAALLSARIDAVARNLAQAKPAAAPALAASASGLRQELEKAKVSRSSKKALREEADDAVLAPVGGW